MFCRILKECLIGFWNICAKIIPKPECERERSVIVEKKELFQQRTDNNVPWGEFWINSGVFLDLNYVDNLESHLEICRQFDMDFISLPIGDGQKSCFSYRLFNITDVVKAKKDNRFVAAVLDGPFQNLLENPSVFSTLAKLSRKSDETLSELKGKTKKVGELATACISSGANAVVIADDIAFSSNTYFGPLIFKKLLHPLYSGLVESIHNQNAYAIFHSDGNISNVLPDLVSARFDGINCQQECVDLSILEKAGTLSPILVTSIQGEFLDCVTLPLAQMESFSRAIFNFAKNRNLVLCSCCGMNSVKNLRNAQKLRQFVKDHTNDNRS
jgi:hypothetical protein